REPGFESSDPALARLTRSASDPKRLGDVAESMLEVLGPRLARVRTAGIGQVRRPPQGRGALEVAGSTLEARQLQRGLPPPRARAPRARVTPRAGLDPARQHQLGLIDRAEPIEVPSSSQRPIEITRLAHRVRQ